MHQIYPFLAAMIIPFFSGCVSEPAEVPHHNVASGNEAETSEPASPPGQGDPVATAPDDPPVAPPATNGSPKETAVQHIEVYSSSGWVVVGAAPGHPKQPGPLVDDLEPVRLDTFLAPPGTIDLDVTVRDPPLTIRSGGFEIYDANGALVYANGFLLGHNAVGGGCSPCWGDWASVAAKPGPGLYTVAYYMVGAAVHMTVIVEAVVEVDDSPAPPPVATGIQDEKRAESPELYSSSGWIIGAAPAHPFKTGPLVDDLEPVRKDTFLAPPGTTAFSVSVRDFVGVWSGGIEITDAHGQVVYFREHRLAQGGAGGAYVMGGPLYAGPVTPGLYTVSYYIAGVAQTTVAVEAHFAG